ncbi:MAG TPA: hypothetical protein VJO32_05995, partial [Ktedonobacteraceae bacterium]|nr:hypothetical protein [Ktedonobacteraceae bacterium]
ENLSTTIVDNSKLIHRSKIMWKTYPPSLWKSGWLAGCYVDNVENLSTAIVDNSKTYPPLENNVENLSTTIVDNSKRLYFQLESLLSS